MIALVKLCNPGVNRGESESSFEAEGVSNAWLVVMLVGHRMRIWAFFSRQLLFIPRRPSPKARNFAVSATRWIQNSSLVSPFRWRCPLRLTVETPFAERRSRAGGAPGCSAFARPCQAAMIGTGSLQEPCLHGHHRPVRYLASRQAGRVSRLHPFLRNGRKRLQQSYLARVLHGKQHRSKTRRGNFTSPQGPHPHGPPTAPGGPACTAGSAALLRTRKRWAVGPAAERPSRRRSRRKNLASTPVNLCRGAGRAACRPRSTTLARREAQHQRPPTPTKPRRLACLTSGENPRRPFHPAACHRTRAPTSVAVRCAQRVRLGEGDRGSISRT